MKTMMQFLPKQAAVIFTAAILCAGSAHAEIVTKVEGETIETGLFKEFNTHTPCRIEELKGHEGQMAKFFADAGLNIVTDKDAKCVIEYDGYVTMYRNGPPEDPIPGAEYYILAQKPSVPFALPPLLSEANTSADMDKAANHMAGFDGWLVLSTGGKAAAIAAGIAGVLLPGVGFATTMVAANVGKVGEHIYDSKSPPLGLAHVGITIKRADWGWGYTQLASMHVYAAATTTESPAALLRAAVNGGVAELQAKEDAYYHREPKKVDAATTAASAPVAVPVIGDAAASAPVAVPVISESAASAPVAVPVSGEPAASAPAPAQVVSADKP